MDILRLILANKKFRLGALIFFIIIVIWLLFSYLSKGQLEISSTDQTSQIDVYRGGKENEKAIASAKGSLKVRLGSGNYIVVVSNRQTSIKKSEQVKARETTKDEINLVGPITVEPVLPNGAFGVNPAKITLTYVDDGTGVLYKLDGSGLPKVLDRKNTYQEFQWADQAFGAGKTTNNKIVLYKNGVLSQAALPEPAGKNQVSFSLANDRKLYVSIGPNIWMGKEGQNFQKIYTSDTKNLRPVAGSKYVALVEYRDGQQESTIVILENGQKKMEKEFGVYELVWSPNGDYLAVAGDDDNGVYGPNLDQVHAFYDTKAGAISWLDNNTVVYAVSNAIWQYKLDVSAAQILSLPPNLGAVSSIYTSAKEKYVYFNSAKDSRGSDQALFRLGLDKITQNIPDYLVGLYIFFPSTTTEGCSFSYTNYINPSIISSGSSSDSICKDALTNELKADGLPQGAFQVLYSQNQTSAD